MSMEASTKETYGKTLVELANKIKIILSWIPFYKPKKRIICFHESYQTASLFAAWGNKT